MRRLLAVTGIALLAVAAAALADTAGGGPRLNGVFQVDATILANDIGIQSGSKTTDTYTFKSTCGKGGCPKVVLTRKSGTRNLKTTLQRKSLGVYKGTEGPAPYVCVDPLGTKGEFTGDHKITVTKATKGVAKKISGTLVIHITGCNETIENVSIKGQLAK